MPAADSIALRRFCVTSDMLGRALVGLNSGELEAFTSCNFLCNGERVGTRLHAATTGTDVNFDQALELAVMAQRGSGQIIDVALVIDTDQYSRTPAKPCQPIDLVSIDNLVRQHYVADTAGDHDFGFGDFLATDSAGAAVLDLVTRDIDRLMGFTVRAQACTPASASLSRSVATLRSKASSSMISDGVATSASAMPISAGNVETRYEPVRVIGVPVFHNSLSTRFTCSRGNS